jgi:hypothetical protein
MMTSTIGKIKFHFNASIFLKFAKAKFKKRYTIGKIKKPKAGFSSVFSCAKPIKIEKPSVRIVVSLLQSLKTKRNAAIAMKMNK